MPLTLGRQVGLLTALVVRFRDRDAAVPGEGDPWLCISRRPGVPLPGIGTFPRASSPTRRSVSLLIQDGSATT